MEHQLLYTFVALALLLCTSGTLSAQPIDADAKQVATASNRLAMDLYGRLAGEAKENIFFSPYSIETALGMTYAGARGPTAEQMAKVLHFDLAQDKLHAAFGDLSGSLNRSGTIRDQKAFELVIANALWGQKGYPFNPAFLELIKSKYGGGLEQVDFNSAAACEQARQTINDWAAKQTQEKIKDLIPKGDLTPASPLVLTNAIYFKSNWDHKFAKEATKDEAFHLDAGQTATVPMMHETTRLNYTASADLAAVELPYLFNRLSMIVLLPTKVDGLHDLETSLTADKLNQWMTAMKASSVELSLPKFRFDSAFRLGDTLKAMGMQDAFTRGKADFSGIATAEELYISEVIHKAYVDVNEEGTEAAAATAVVMEAGAAMVRVQNVVFKADHPFLFLIRHNESGAILFIGRVANPKS